MVYPKKPDIGEKMSSYKKQSLEWFLKKKYMQISRHHGLVARVDISERELVRKLIRQGIEAEIPVSTGLKGWYCRVLSLDCIRGVPEDILKRLPVAES